MGHRLTPAATFAVVRLSNSVAAASRRRAHPEKEYCVTRTSSTRPLKAGIVLAVSLTALGLGAAPALAATVGLSGTQLVVDGGPEDDVITIINPAAQTFVVADGGAP